MVWVERFESFKLSSSLANRLHRARLLTLQISMAVCSILYQLATRPDEQEKIHAELLRVLPSDDTPLTSRHLDQMLYLRAFIKEVFRQVSPPVVVHGTISAHRHLLHSVSQTKNS
jgi:hypothetical protein